MSGHSSSKTTISLTCFRDSKASNNNNNNNNSNCSIKFNFNYVNLIPIFLRKII